MSLWRQLTRGLNALTRRESTDRAIADDVEHYLDEAAAMHEARGLSREDAIRAARRELGNPVSVQEQVREYGWENVVETTFADLRYAVRRLRANPVFTAVTVITLGLGIGASTTMFSAAKPVLLDPLPYPDPDRVVMIWDRSSDGSRAEVTFGTFREISERSRSLSTIAVMRVWQPTLSGAAEPERLEGQRVSAGYFQTLGVRPAIGRDLAADDDRPNAPRVAIISDRVWRRRFAADRAIVGSDILLDGQRHLVVGVMPAFFETVLEPGSDVWTPLQYDATLPSLESREWGHHLRMVARLDSAATLSAAQSELDEIAGDPVRAFARPPWAALGGGFLVAVLQEDVTQAVRPALIAVLGAVALLMIIVCVNVTNLLAGRGSQRSAEFAMRAALGAGRGRIVRQQLAETFVLALLGGVAGLVIARIGLALLVIVSPVELPRLHAVDIDTTVVSFAFGLATMVGILVGLIPACHAARLDLRAAIHRGSRQYSDGRAIRSGLVIAEVALAIVVLAGAGLVMRSLQHLFAIPPGFDPANVLTMQVQTSGPRFDNERSIHRFFEEALESVRRQPGVAAAAFTSQLPMTGGNDIYGVHFEATARPPSEEDQGAFRYSVTPEYFEAMGIALRRGRFLNDRDVAGAPQVALISESFARRRFADQDPIGQRIHIGRSTGPWFTTVGVVADVKHASLSIGRSDAVYVSPTQWHFADRAMWLVVRGYDSAAATPAAIRDAIWAVDKDQPIVRVNTMASLLASSESQRRFVLVLFEAFGLAALLLAATGVYGVLASGVSERRREIGVRVALGASRTTILNMVIRQGLTLTVIGIAIGTIVAMLASDAMVALLFGISRLDPATYASVAALLVAVAAIACLIPAWHAARIDPLATLRQE